MSEFQPGDEPIVLGQIKQAKWMIDVCKLKLEKLSKQAKSVQDDIRFWEESLGSLNRQLAELLNKERPADKSTGQEIT